MKCQLCDKEGQYPICPDCWDEVHLDQKEQSKQIQEDSKDKQWGR